MGRVRRRVGLIGRRAIDLICALMLASVLLVFAGCGGAGGTTATQQSPNATATATAVSSVRYVALGASDAMGVGASNPYTQGYVPLIIAKLPPGAFRLNLGVSGIELHQALQQELPRAVAAKPTLMTIWLAANDFKDCVPLAQYTTDLDTLLGQLTTETSAHIFIANLPDMSALPAMQDASQIGSCLAVDTSAQMRAQLAQWNSAIAAAASRYHITLVDLAPFNIAAHPEYISGDGFHPSSAGYAQLADLFWASITNHGGLS